jgi:hypothetical protein
MGITISTAFCWCLRESNEHVNNTQKIQQTESVLNFENLKLKRNKIFLPGTTHKTKHTQIKKKQIQTLTSQNEKFHQDYDYSNESTNYSWRWQESVWQQLMHFWGRIHRRHCKLSYTIKETKNLVN